MQQLARTTVRCPKCGGPTMARFDEMVLHCCSLDCHYKMALPEDIRLRRGGAPMLPGMEG